MGLARGQLAKAPSTDELEMMLIVGGKKTEELASPMPPLTKGTVASLWLNLQFRCAVVAGTCASASPGIYSSQQPLTERQKFSRYWAIL